MKELKLPNWLTKEFAKKWACVGGALALIFVVFMAIAINHGNAQYCAGVEYGYGWIKSPSEFQEHLKDNGYYKGEIDGILGPKTMKAWELAFGDQCARPYFEKETE